MNVQEILRTARLISWLYRIVAAVSGLLVIRMIMQRLGIEAYGEIAFVVALLGGLVAMDLGFIQALPRFVARYSSDEHAARRPVFWAACTFAAIALLLIQMLVVAALSLAIGLFDEVQSLGAGEFLALGATMILANVVAIGGPIAAGFQRYGLAGTGKVLRSLLYLFAVWMMWLSGTLSVRSVLWANALAFLCANVPVAVALWATFRIQTARSWQGFPRAHYAEITEISSYSLNGWLFTAANVIVTSGTIFIAGVLFTAQDIALLQMALVLYTAVAALVTGSMVPLSTIAARHQDGSATGRKAIAATALNLVEEALVFAAGLMIFFIHFGTLMLAFLMGGSSENPDLLANAYYILLAITLPAFAALPLFTFRFVLVSTDENRAFSRGTLMTTLTLLGLGALMAALLKHPLPLALGAGAALSWRAVVGYRMGRHALPGISAVRMTGFLLTAAVFFEVAYWLSSVFRLRVFGLPAEYLQAGLFFLLALVLYFQRARLEPLLGVRT
jgi:O-antigen/teichoic acid export membrane protein